MTNGNSLSPLDQIRQAEAEAARQLVLAREAESKKIQDSHLQAAELYKKARAEAEAEGQARYKEILAKSEEEATALVAESRRKTEKLRVAGQKQITSLVSKVVKFITGMKADI